MVAGGASYFVLSACNQKYVSGGGKASCHKGIAYLA